MEDNSTPPKNSRKKRLLFFIVSTLFLTTYMITLIFLSHTEIPVFCVTSLYVFNFSNSSTSPSLITGNWNVTLNAQNPNNKFSLYYDKITATVSYRDALISQNTLPPFHQQMRALPSENINEEVNATLVAVGAYVERWAVDEITNNRISKGSVTFDVVLKAFVQYKAKDFWRKIFDRDIWLDIKCQGLEVGLMPDSGNASLIDYKRDRVCKIEQSSKMRY